MSAYSEPTIRSPMRPHGRARAIVRNTQPQDVDQIIALGELIYPKDEPWRREHFQSQMEVFPQGQLVAVDPASHRVLGSAASLIVKWDEYHPMSDWDEFTDGGFFTNHDPEGRTLYGADVMVHPEARGLGVGKAIYAARRRLCRQHHLQRIRAGARLAGYHRYARQLDPSEYVSQVLRGEIGDPTLSFQVKQGFQVVAVIPGYLPNDPASLGWAALIEWINR